MSTMDQLREGLSRAWETVTEGWRELAERTGDALTRFHTSRTHGELETREDRIARESANWSLLAAEMSVRDDEVEVAIEIPGMEPDNFDIQVADDVLVVRGEKRVESERAHGDFQLMERAYGRFERAMRLPVPVDDDSAKASYKRGVLRITLPRSTAGNARRIEVKGA